MKKILPISILLILLYAVFFLHLGKQPLRLWDESRLAHNAYEMVENGNLIVTHFEGKPEMWNLKPPLVIWCQALLIKMMGPKELAIRLPSAIFGLLTALLLLFYCWRYLDNFWMGFFAAMVLATTKGYIDEHGARHGEYDSYVIFFMLFYALSFLQYFEKKNIKYLYWGMAGLTFAVLVKGIGGFFLLPVIFFTALFYSAIIPTLKSRHFYISAAGFLFIIAGYYLLREHYNPGYLQAVFDNEISGRYLTTLEQHNEPFWFYFYKIKDVYLEYWLLLIPCGITVGFFSTDASLKRFILFATSSMLFLFFLMTFSQTKAHWYIFPVFPFTAIIVAYFIWIIFKLIGETDVKKTLTYNILPFIFIFMLFILPCRSIIDRVYQAPEFEWDKDDYSMGYFLKDVVNGKKEIKEPLKVLYSGYKAHLTFYVNILQKRNVPVTAVDPYDVKQGDLVLCSKNEDLFFLESHFDLDKVDDSQYMHLFRLKEIKQ